MLCSPTLFGYLWDPHVAVSFLYSPPHSLQNNRWSVLLVLNFLSGWVSLLALKFDLTMLRQLYMDNLENFCLILLLFTIRGCRDTVHGFGLMLSSPNGFLILCFHGLIIILFFCFDVAAVVFDTMTALHLICLKVRSDPAKNKKRRAIFGVVSFGFMFFIDHFLVSPLVLR